MYLASPKVMQRNSRARTTDIRRMIAERWASVDGGNEEQMQTEGKERKKQRKGRINQEAREDGERVWRRVSGFPLGCLSMWVRMKLGCCLSMANLPPPFRLEYVFFERVRHCLNFWSDRGHGMQILHLSTLIALSGELQSLQIKMRNKIQGVVEPPLSSLSLSLSFCK